MSPALTHPIRAKHTKGYSVHVLPKIFDVNAKGASILKLSQPFPNKIFHDAYFDQKRAAIIECFFLFAYYHQSRDPHIQFIHELYGDGAAVLMLELWL